MTEVGGADVPSVTVVIATRDRPELLRQAIDGILAQDFAGAIDVVVVFDQTAVDDQVATERPGRRVVVTANMRQPGLAGSRNTGIDLAFGRYVAFCDDDDVWHPTKLRKQVQLLCDTGGFFATCGITVEFEGECHERVLVKREIDFCALLRDRHAELHPSTFVFDRAWAAYHLGGVDESLPYGFGEDYDLLLRATRQSPLYNLPEALVTVRWTGGSYFFQRWKAMATALTWLLDTYPEFDEVPRGAARLHGQVAFAWAAQRQRREAWRWVRSTLVRNPREPRAYLALAVGSGLVSPARVMEALHKRGRGM